MIRLAVSIVYPALVFGSYWLFGSEGPFWVIGLTLLGGFVYTCPAWNWHDH